MKFKELKKRDNNMIGFNVFKEDLIVINVKIIK